MLGINRLGFRTESLCLFEFSTLIEQLTQLFVARHKIRIALKEPR
jgi:hypothetical protein